MVKILFSNFERTEFSDSYFSMIGRALTIVTRFEQSCKNLDLLISTKINKNIVENEKEFKEFIYRIHKKQLFDHIQDIVNLTSNGLTNKLHVARKDRNYLVHNFLIGFDDSFDSFDKNTLVGIKKEIKLRLFRIAEADLVISLLILIYTNESIPNKEFFYYYIDKIMDWILAE